MDSLSLILNIENLTKTYGAVPNQTKALNGITFQVMPGEFLGIMGSSGSGKTTLLNCIAAVVKPAGGSIVMEDRNLRSLDGRALAEYRGKTVGYLFQNFELLDNLTGRENILLPASLHKVTEKTGSLRLKQLAEYLEITDVLDKFPGQMSGGQRQRVAAARAMILHPKLILADEPTGALDSKNAKNLMEKLSSLNQEEQATILMATHDSGAASFCKRILFIQDGVIFHEIRRGDESRQRAAESLVDKTLALRRVELFAAHARCDDPAIVLKYAAVTELFEHSVCRRLFPHQFVGAELHQFA